MAINLGNKTLAMFNIALATYLSLYPAMLVIPVVLMLIRDIKDSTLVKVHGSIYLFRRSSVNMGVID